MARRHRRFHKKMTPADFEILQGLVKKYGTYGIMRAVAVVLEGYAQRLEKSNELEDQEAAGQLWAGAIAATECADRVDDIIA